MPRTVTTTAPESFYAEDQPESEEFIKELVRLMFKHKLAIVPTAGGSISFHDHMRVVPLDEETLDFIRESDVCFQT